MCLPQCSVNQVTQGVSSGAALWRNTQVCDTITLGALQDGRSCDLGSNSCHHHYPRSYLHLAAGKSIVHSTDVQLRIIDLFWVEVTTSHAVQNMKLVSSLTVIIVTDLSCLFCFKCWSEGKLRIIVHWAKTFMSSQQHFLLYIGYLCEMKNAQHKLYMFPLLLLF